ncbi:MAG TPA: glycosyltransferase [Terriglobia bacterium]|nr:glycosyltransferase [Terriglobia bacterium]
MATRPRILILSTPHGAAHQRAALALQKAFRDLSPVAEADVIDTLRHTTAWFRAYYDSYVIPLALWPGLWRWIESKQHQSQSTGPGWLYRKAAKPLSRYLRDYAPDAVIATEVGACELAALCKRQSGAGFALVGVELMDFNRAWIQPEVDLFLTTHEDLGAELVSAGAVPSRVITTGQPIDPAFVSLAPRATVREKLGVKKDAVQILVTLGSQGFGRPELILQEILKVPQPVQAVMVTGRNRRVQERLRKYCERLPQVRVLGWVNNMHEWMQASDLMISKPGGGTLNEGFACGLPMLAFNPLPGNEERTCRWIEKWEAGIWIRKSEDLAPTLTSLLSDRSRLEALRAKVSKLARPYAARDGAQAVMKLLAERAKAR